MPANNYSVNLTGATEKRRELCRERMMTFSRENLHGKLRPGGGPLQGDVLEGGGGPETPEAGVLVGKAGFGWTVSEGSRGTVGRAWGGFGVGFWCGEALVPGVRGGDRHVTQKRANTDAVLSL